jgi:hypothetical protein
MRRIFAFVSVGSLLLSSPLSTVVACDGHLFRGCHRICCPPPHRHDPPVANNDAYVIPMNVALNVATPGVLGNDVSPSGSALSVISFTQPAHGTATLYVNGALAYVPNSNYTGPDTFTYVISDGAYTSNAATVSLTVTPPQAVPSANNDSYTLTKNTTLNIPAPGVLGNDSSPDGRPLSVFSFTRPAHGTTTVTGDGSFTYTPAANFTGTDSFSYIASNGTTQSNIARVSLTITDVSSGNPVTPP